MRSLLRLIFYPLYLIFEVLFRTGLKIHREFWSRPFRLKEPVVSIGNIVAGGSGKSPFVIALARRFSARRMNVAILTRGYRSGLKRGEYVVLLDGQAVMQHPDVDVSTLRADEAMMQSVKLAGTPVIVGADRQANALRWAAEHRPPDVWILDDGFQHHHLARDVDIVIDLPRESMLLPFGRLREPRSSLRRVDFIASYDSSGDLQLTVAELAPELKCKGKKDHAKGEVVALCSIAHPERFAETLKKSDFSYQRWLTKADHRYWSRADFVGLEIAKIVMTEKDYYRQPQDWEALGIEIWTVPIELRIVSTRDSQSDWFDLVMARIHDKRQNESLV